MDFWNLWSKKTGVPVIFRVVPNAEFIEEILNQKADIIAGTASTSGKGGDLHFSNPFHKVSCYIFHRTDLNLPRGIEDLSGHRVGVVAGSSFHEFVRTEQPGANIIQYPDIHRMITGGVKGELDAFLLENPVAMAYLTRLEGLAVFEKLSIPTITKYFHAAVHKENRELLLLVNKGLASITQEEMDTIVQTWISKITPSATSQPFQKGIVAAVVRKWMKAFDIEIRDTLVIGISDGYMPFSGLNFKGEPTGMFVDIWSLWARKTGQRIEFLATEWEETLNVLKSGDIDIHSGLFRTKERQVWMDFSQPFYMVASTIFYHPQHFQLVGMDDLTGQQVGAVKGSYQAQYLRDEYPNVELVAFIDTEAMIYAALDGQIQAFADETPVTQTYLALHGEGGTFKRLNLILFSRKIHAGIEKDKNQLLTLIDTGFYAITDQELADIEQLWILVPELRQYAGPAQEIRLTETQATWLKNNQLIRLGVGPDWPPFDYFGRNGSYMGIAAGYVAILEEQLGITMDPLSAISRTDILAIARAGELDVIACIAKTPELEEFLSFTQPYLQFPIVVVTRDDFPFIKELSELKGKDIVMFEEYITKEFLTTDLPELNISSIESLENGLAAVNKKKADALIGDLASIGYAIKKMGTVNLKIAATTPYDLDLCFGVHKDLPILVEALDKALASISEQEKSKLYDDWIVLRYEQDINWGQALRWILGIGCAAAFLFFIILRWNRRLAHEIAERKSVERELRKFSLAIEESNTSVIITNAQGRIEYVNPGFSEATGYNPEEAIGKNLEFLRADEQLDEKHRTMWDTVLAGKNWRGEFCNKKKNGEVYWEHVVISPIRNEEGEITNLIGVQEDISNRKRIEEELKRAKKEAEAASRAKSDFLANMSHEIRTPMNAVIGLAHLALQNKPDEKMTDYLQKIQSSSKSLLGIINDILDFSKIEAHFTRAR